MFRRPLAALGLARLPERAQVRPARGTTVGSLGARRGNPRFFRGARLTLTRSGATPARVDAYHGTTVCGLAGAQRGNLRFFRGALSLRALRRQPGPREAR